MNWLFYCIGTLFRENIEFRTEYKFFPLTEKEDNTAESEISNYYYYYLKIIRLWENLLFFTALIAPAELDQSIKRVLRQYEL